MKIGKLELGKRPVVAGVVTSMDDLTEELVRPADLLELRIDMFPDTNIKFIKELIEKARTFDKPLLATVRSAREGGIKKIHDRDRYEILISIIPYVDAVDIEISFPKLFNKIKPLISSKRKIIIGSYHNFRTTPPISRLEGIFKKGKKMGSAIIKIATTPKNREDLIRLAEFTLRHRKDKIITIAMGNSGIASRIFFPMLGSLITFASLTESSAPGQLSVKEIMNYFDILDGKKI